MRKILATSILIIALLPTKALAKDRISMGYIYSTTKSHTEIVDATNDSVNVVSPTAFGINSKGGLIVENILKKSFVEEMHEKNIKVTPFLSNQWSRKAANKVLNNPDKIIYQIVEAVDTFDLDGINIDIENIDVSMKDKLTSFVKLLREKLPDDKIISVAVAANPQKLNYSWVASYDYKNLASVSDYLVVMTYDEHCYAGSEGAVASIGFVEKSIQNILEEVSRDKILMGIPLYGRFWKDGEAVGGEAIVIGKVNSIIKQYKLTPKYNEITATPMITLKVKQGTQGPNVNGRCLESRYL